MVFVFQRSFFRLLLFLHIQPFKVNRLYLPQAYVAAVWVVPGSNSGKDREACLGVRLPDSAVYEFALQRRKEALRHGVVLKLTIVPMLGRTPNSLQRLPHATCAL